MGPKEFNSLVSGESVWPETRRGPLMPGKPWRPAITLTTQLDFAISGYDTAHCGCALGYLNAGDDPRYASGSTSFFSETSPATLDGSGIPFIRSFPLSNPAAPDEDAGARACAASLEQSLSIRGFRILPALGTLLQWASQSEAEADRIGVRVDTYEAARGLTDYRQWVRQNLELIRTGLQENIDALSSSALQADQDRAAKLQKMLDLVQAALDGNDLPYRIGDLGEERSAMLETFRQRMLEEYAVGQDQLARLKQLKEVYREQVEQAMHRLDELIQRVESLPPQS